MSAYLRASRTRDGYAVSGLRLRKDGYITGWYYFHGARYQGIWYGSTGIPSYFKWPFASPHIIPGSGPAGCLMADLSLVAA